MKIKSLLPVFLLASSVLLAACGGDANNAADVFADEMNRIADAVEQVQTAEDARNVAEIITDARARMDVATAEIEAMSDVEKAMMSSAHASKIAQAQARIATSMSMLAMRDPEALKIISAEFRKIKTPG
ncbi:hypothetical protein [Pyruvatibacter sp.]|uniref:hypothetical protein n=1 Tax=Pyruvatibacter sp. TaxID=1981328 RepID=UPI0032EF6313